MNSKLKGFLIFAVIAVFVGISAFLAKNGITFSGNKIVIEVVENSEMFYEAALKSLDKEKRELVLDVDGEEKVLLVKEGTEIEWMESLISDANMKFEFRYSEEDELLYFESINDILEGENFSKDIYELTKISGEEEKAYVFKNEEEELILDNRNVVNNVLAQLTDLNDEDLNKKYRITRNEVGRTTILSYETIRQGLDLKGGVRVVYEANDKAYKDEDLVKLASSVVSETVDVSKLRLAMSSMRKSDDDYDKFFKAFNGIKSEDDKLEIAKLLIKVSTENVNLQFINRETEDLTKKLNLANEDEIYIVEEIKNFSGLNISTSDMSAAIGVMRRRLDLKGYTEADIARQGERRIIVEIPGMSDPKAAIELLGKTAKLSFVDPEGTIVVTGEQVKVASVQLGPEGPYVNLVFTDEGTIAFAKATRENLNKRISIMLDDELISSPKVENRIDGGVAQITSSDFGYNNGEEAKKLAELINSGSIPFKLEVLEYSGVGATLGAEALASSVEAGKIGLMLVLVFMLLVYRLPGMLADLALVGYLAVMLLVLSIFNVTLTLPGIAGIILSVGMAVDANVIIFTRIKEELNAGKTTESAVKAGFRKALSAIIDGNMTTLISAGILYAYGTGPIKGFAQTLGLGIFVSMFTALVVTRFLLIAAVSLGIKNIKLYGGK
ncbi:MAG: protein translocase subunit SecD [Clostridia bacterium]|jgi:protein-export SecD/SecF family membrane protein|nr:protein translocase subunit SecD [Clostridia bacterium]